jgi:hypothetical protein
MTIQDLLSTATDGNIVVNTAKFLKTFQNDLNVTPKVPILWAVPAVWDNISNFTPVNPISTSQFSFPVGYFFVTLSLEVFSPTSAKLQVRLSHEISGAPQLERGYSGLTVATDNAGSNLHIFLSITNPGTIVEFFGERSGTAGTIDVVGGELTILRMTNRTNIPK